MASHEGKDIRDPEAMREMLHHEVDETHRLSQASASSDQSRQRSGLKTFVGPWELGLDLGRGMSASVRKARHTNTGEIVAVKIINLRRATKMQTQSILAIDRHLDSAAQADSARRGLPMVLRREIAILKAIDHPNVTRLIDIWENRGNLYLFMEFVENGELLDYIIKHRYLSEVETVRIFRQLISGVQHCHRFLLCHRDIKPENILLDRDHNIKLADFGMAAMHNNQLLRTSCGSPHYAAPEIVLGRPYKGHLADVWSCGVVLFVMLTGGVPFGGEFDSDQVREIITQVLEGRLDYGQTPASVSWPARDLVSKILERNPDRRLPLSAVWYHPLFRKYENIARIPEQRKFWIGSPVNDLTAADCGPQMHDAGEIDTSVLEGLCILWQTQDSSRFVKALLDPEPSYEKILYRSLLKYRIEQEENLPLAVTLQPSPSDYHHITPRPLRKASTRASLLGPGTAGRASQFSIVQPTSRQTSVISRRTLHSGSGSGSGRSGSVPDTDSTYDPYRSSKPQVVYKGDPYTRFDMVRVTSGSSKASTMQRVTRRGPSSSAWSSTLGSSVLSMASSPPQMPRDTTGRIRALRHTTAVHRSYSKSSLGSSINSQGSGKSLRFSKTPSYRRNVSFRRFSDLPPRPDAPTPVSRQQQYVHDRLREETPELPSSPGNRKGPSGRSMPDMKASILDPKEAAAPRTPHSSMGIHLAALTNEAATRASAELSKYCDVAFSSSSSRQRSEDDVFLESPTPVPNSKNAALAARLSSPSPANTIRSSLRRSSLDKDLPDVPSEAHNPLQVQRKLIRALQRLREEERELGPGRLEGAMAEIERAMWLNAPGIAQSNYQHRISIQERRAQSENDGGRIHDLSLSPVREVREYESPHRSQQLLHGRRHVSEPFPPTVDRFSQEGRAAQRGSVPVYPGPTIRVVPKSPAPVTVFSNHDEPLPAGIAVDPTSRTIEPRVIPNRRGSLELLSAYTNAGLDDVADIQAAEGRLDTIREHDDQLTDNEAKHESGGSRLKSLFRRNSTSSKSLDKSPTKHLSYGSTDKLSKTNLQGPGTSRVVLSRRSSRDADGTLAAAAGRVDDWQDQMHHAVAARNTSVAGTGDSEFPHRGDPSTKRHVRSRSLGFWQTLFRREKRDPMQLVEPGDTDSIFTPSSLGSQTQRSTPNASALSVGRRRGSTQDATSPVSVEDHYNSPWPKLTRRVPSRVYPHQLQDQPVNWLARLLQVRPAVRVLAFDAYRTRMLKEIRNVFRDWHRYGVRDVVVEKSAGRIWARVIDKNGLGGIDGSKGGEIAGFSGGKALKIKPVEIMVEVYSVVYTKRTARGAAAGTGTGVDAIYGRSAKGKAREGTTGGGMSIARMRQVRGAKSSFDTCADQLERIFKERSLLVRDKSKAKEMKRCLNELGK